MPEPSPRSTRTVNDSAEDVSLSVLEAAPGASPPVDRLGPDLEPLTEAPEDPKYVRKRWGLGFWLAATWLGLLLFGALFAAWLPIADPNETFRGLSREGPSLDHWFGGDNIGKDIFSRCVYGARKSLAVGVFAYAGALVIGGTFGLVAGYYRNRIETTITGALDVMLAFPPLVLLIAIGAFLGTETKNLIMALTILAVPSVARIVRALVLTYREREFVLSARALGTRNMRVMIRDILPNVIPTVGAFALIGVANLIVAEGALAFVGVSDPNEVSWGVMINQGRDQIDRASHIVVFPSMMIFLTVLSMNYMGDRIRERLAVKESNV
ncbi:MAG: ABC transporter permease subunit [Acidimicrobiia bacterium]|nr:ABC transporter permease subunit [Acidimicrobiia bacterium]